MDADVRGIGFDAEHIVSDARRTNPHAEHFASKITVNKVVAARIGGKVLHIEFDVRRTKVCAGRIEVDVGVPREKYGSKRAVARRIVASVLRNGVKVGEISGDVAVMKLSVAATGRNGNGIDAGYSRLRRNDGPTGSSNLGAFFVRGKTMSLSPGATRRDSDTPRHEALRYAAQKRRGPSLHSG